MKSIYSFSLNSLDDKSLETLYNDVCREINARTEARAAKRAGWVRQMCDFYLRHPNATSMQIGEVTIVSVYSRHAGLCMGKARPVNDDEYNSDVGIAVAYAKAIGVPVPDYI